MLYLKILLANIQYLAIKCFGNEFLALITLPELPFFVCKIDPVNIHMEKMTI